MFDLGDRSDESAGDSRGAERAATSPPDRLDVSEPSVPDRRRSAASSYSSDLILVDLALGGEEQAWEILQDRYHTRLLNWTNDRLRKSTLVCLAEDIGQLVWISLWSDRQRRLRAYDPRRASFFQFLKIRACNLISYAHRAAKRRREVSLGAIAALPDRSGNDWFFHVAAEEVFATLSPRERQLALNHLERSTNPFPLGISAANRWKLTQRVREKVHAYFQSE